MPPSPPQDLQRLAPDVLNCCDACLVEGRQERLERMLGLLEQCEKALQDYLETKRIAFPRFYFVSPADLLDILAKGNNPQYIVRHLAKCFDNVHGLRFAADGGGGAAGAAAGAPTSDAVGMLSGEGEYVAFTKPCPCVGGVEVWLQRVVDAMRDALRAEFKEALPAYDEKPRAKWIFDQSVQNTVVITRVAYTQEVNSAFEMMEEGNEARSAAKRDGWLRREGQPLPPAAAPPPRRANPASPPLLPPAPQAAVKDVMARQVTQIAALIKLINGDLSKNDRKKIVTLCTIDVHARDVARPRPPPPCRRRAAARHHCCSPYPPPSAPAGAAPGAGPH